MRSRAKTGLLIALMILAVIVGVGLIEGAFGTAAQTIALIVAVFALGFYFGRTTAKR